MTRVAAVDCGTNSLRLLVADLAGGALTELHREMRIVRLGEGVDRTGELSPGALERVGQALTDYAQTCRELGVQAVRLVATSATRDARNRADFTDLVRRTLGVTPEVVSGEQEAQLSFTGATHGLDPADAPFLVLDIGGGSTEFVLGARQVQAVLSVDVGCVRLTERHLHDDPPTPRQVAAAQADVTAALDRVRAAVPVRQARTAVGLAGSVTTVAALALGLQAYDARAIHLSRLDEGTVSEVTDRFAVHDARAACGAAGRASRTGGRHRCRGAGAAHGDARPGAFAGAGQRGGHPGRHRAQCADADAAGDRRGMSKDDWVSQVRRQDKPWGHEELFALVDGKFCGKAIHVDEGHALSLQYHEHKEEVISVQSGRLRCEVGLSEDALEQFELLPGESVHLRPGVRHRVTALVDTVMLEASTTELHDVVRLEDRYGRQGTSAP